MMIDTKRVEALTDEEILDLLQVLTCHAIVANFGGEKSPAQADLAFQVGTVLIRRNDREMAKVAFTVAANLT